MNKPLTINSPLSRNNQRGMTLIEVLAVIVLIALIMGVVARGIFGKSDAAKAELNIVKMENVMRALETYRLKYNSYPSSLDDLIKPGDKKLEGKIFMKLADEDELLDIWGFPYIYKAENNNRTYTLSSLGADGIEGGDSANSDVTKRP